MAPTRDEGALVPDRRTKYGNIRTWSELCGRLFDSRAEAIRGEELRLLELAGAIRDLEYQPSWRLSLNPSVTYRADFRYLEGGDHVVEDVKGVLTAAARVKLAWLKEQRGLRVRLLRREDRGWDITEL